MEIIIISLVINFAISIFLMTEARCREISQIKVFWISFCLSPLIGALALYTSKESDNTEKFEFHISLKILISIVFLINISYFGLKWYNNYKFEQYLIQIEKDKQEEQLNLVYHEVLMTEICKELLKNEHITSNDSIIINTNGFHNTLNFINQAYSYNIITAEELSNLNTKMLNYDKRNTTINRKTSSNYQRY